MALVNDGWSGRPSPFLHQLLLLPLTLVGMVGLLGLLQRRQEVAFREAMPVSLSVCVIFEVVSLLGFRYEAKHFAQFGYHISPTSYLLVVGAALLGAVGFVRYRSSVWLIGAAIATYVVGEWLSIVSFPLNYLRSDMLPVVQWADLRLVQHLNPYATMHVGSRLYDFPYLPGVLLAYLPTIALGIDPRWLNLCSVSVVAGLLYWAAVPKGRLAAAALVALFVLSPFLQYRHDLYLAPHWLLLTAAMVLVQRRWFGCGAAVFGLSMAVYQLSWVIWPFLLLYALQRRGWWEALRSAGFSLLAMAAVVGPFLRSALQRIASNTVGQWSRLPHALADPINLSYWMTYLVRPDQLKWVQLSVLTAVFFYCLVMGRCRTLEDTLRWMCVALAIFIALNVLVDGYFYLTLLLLLLMYTLIAEQIWLPADREELTMAPSGYLAATGTRFMGR